VVKTLSVQKKTFSTGKKNMKLSTEKYVLNTFQTSPKMSLSTEILFFRTVNMTLSIENSTPSNSTKSRNPTSSVLCGGYD